MVADHRQVRRESGQLPLPVADHGCGADHQVWPVAVATGQQCDGLQCLAQSHVVCQQRTHAEFGHGLQPRHTPSLVGAQDRLDVVEVWLPGRVRLLQPTHQVAQRPIRDHLDGAELRGVELAGQSDG